jgi:hypothetical protein
MYIGSLFNSNEIKDPQHKLVVRRKSGWLSSVASLVVEYVIVLPN